MFAAVYSHLLQIISSDKWSLYMHLIIYHTDSKLFSKENTLEEALLNLPLPCHERAYRYKFEEGAYNFVVGRLLLKKGMKHLNLTQKLEDISYAENGKPGLNGFSFNISHSGNLVVCALSLDGIIGVDVERIKPIKLEDFEPWFTPKEWLVINADDTLHTFYWYWTRKESIIKALGVNLDYLNKIELDAGSDIFIENGKKWYLRDIALENGFLGALCTEYLVEKIEIKLS